MREVKIHHVAKNCSNEKGDYQMESSVMLAMQVEPAWCGQTKP